MGYHETEGIVLRRQDRFETDQFIQLLTEHRGVLSVRVPHGQKSQKTHCGRLEAPNHVDARLYQSREDGPWTLSESRISTVFADLMANKGVKKFLWPLIALFDDLFPEGQSPGRSYQRFKKALSLLKDGVRPALLVADRLLVKTALEMGVAIDPSRCLECGTTEADGWSLAPDRGLFCESCEPDVETTYELDGDARQCYQWFLEDEWGELAARELRMGSLRDVESLMYRLFHYHFEISLETLKVRQSL
jgi:DNA repair protein RecO